MEGGLESLEREREEETEIDREREREREKERGIAKGERGDGMRQGERERRMAR